MAESESVMVVEPSSSSRMDQKETLQVDESALADRKHDLSEIFVSNHHNEVTDSKIKSNTIKLGSCTGKIACR